jgi:HlyD family secretion protein
MKLQRLMMWGAVAIALMIAIALTMAARPTDLAAPEDDIPLVKVSRSDLDLKVYTTGELRASHSAELTAPAIGGGALKITRLLHAGTRVKKGDVVVEFDPIEQRYKLEQSRSELLQAEQEIIKAKADAAVQAAEDTVALLKARFDVRRAELEVQKNELASTIDATKNQLSLDQARRALAELDQDIKSHATSGQAGVGLAQEKWAKANLAMKQAGANIEKMKILSPMDGLVSIEKNLDANGGPSFGITVPDYHEGDQTRAGSAVAQVIDPHELELTAKISETDRSNIAVGEPVEVVFDALPGRTFHGTVISASEMAQRQLWDYLLGGGGKFDATVQLAETESRLRPGLTAQIAISGGKQANALCVLRQALFQKDGKQIVYLKKGMGYEQREVKVRGENESRAAIEGLKAGDEVALVDPTAPRRMLGPGLSSQETGGTP